MIKQSNNKAFSWDHPFWGKSALLRTDFGIPLSLIRNFEKIMEFKHLEPHATNHKSPLFLTHLNQGPDSATHAFSKCPDNIRIPELLMTFSSNESSWTISSE